MQQVELDAILSDEAENPPTRGELFSQRNKFDVELAQQQAMAKIKLAPLKKARDEATQTERLTTIAYNNAELSCRDKENGLKNSVSALNARLRDSAPAAITRLINTIHTKRIAFQEYPFNRQLRREHRGILGGRSFAEQNCDAWISEAMKTFLRLQNEAEDLRLLDCEDLDAEIAAIFAEIPDVEKPEYVEV
jgi:L-lactate utilization protein LutC